MVVICNECGCDIVDKGIALMAGLKEGEEISWAEGAITCYRHFDGLRVHSLEEMNNGVIYFLEDIS